MSYAVVWPEGVENFVEVFKLLKNYYYYDYVADLQPLEGCERYF